MKFNSEDNGKTILKNREITDEPVKLKNCEDCTIIGCDFSYNKSGEAMLTLENCKRCKVLKCDFHDKDTKGNFIKIIGKESKENLIEGCEFYDHTYDRGNGGEPVRIGESPYSGCRFNTKVRYCRFRNLTADPETVSIKSCGNLLEHNEHIDCDSNFTIRHGGFNKIKNNKFTGSGGIRVYGNTNEITGNYHQNNNNDNTKRRPLWIGNANFEDDLNFDRQGRPTDPPRDKKKACSHAGYARAKNNTIEDNIYDNCKGTCVVWGVQAYPRKIKKTCDGKKIKVEGPKQLPIPSKNKFRKNTIIGDQINRDTTLLEFSSSNTYEKAKEAENVFKANKLYKAKRGDIPEEQGDTLETRPGIEIPSAGPEALEAVAAASS